jgi:hypothetical protein
MQIRPFATRTLTTSTPPARLATRCACISFRLSNYQIPAGKNLRRCSHDWGQLPRQTAAQPHLKGGVPAGGRRADCAVWSANDIFLRKSGVKRSR